MTGCPPRQSRLAAEIRADVNATAAPGSAWALLRLASPQLPIGGYSYSQGLEMAVENGWVNDSDSARRWLEDQLLLNLARFEAPLLLTHCEAAAQFLCYWHQRPLCRCIASEARHERRQRLDRQ